MALLDATHARVGSIALLACCLADWTAFDCLACCYLRCQWLVLPVMLLLLLRLRLHCLACWLEQLLIALLAAVCIVSGLCCQSCRLQT